MTIQFVYEAVNGFFVQADDNVNAAEFNHLKDFGLKKESWAVLKNDLRQLQNAAPENVRYKLLFLARHGQGWHNLAEKKYGTKEWEAKWAKLNGDGTILWGPDAELTELGVRQAKENNAAWNEQVTKGVPLPEAFYSSPFTRALDTMTYTWDGIQRHEGVKAPLVKEDIREDMGIHTCDKRRPRSYTAKRFPDVVIEKGFTEADELWKPDYREKPGEHDMRTRKFLDFLFTKDFDAPPDEPAATYVSVTSHSGTCNSFLRVIGHRPFPLDTGGMIPVVIKATRQ